MLSDPTSQPDHLEPIDLYDFQAGYHHLVFEKLVGQERVMQRSTWMICIPSFSPEYAVILFAEKKHRKAEAKWFAEVANAAEQFWGTGPEARDRAEAVTVNRTRIEIDEKSAEAFMNAWLAVTRQTRYAKHQSGGIDGVSYHFYANGYCGKTWSPSSGLPAALVRSAEELIKIVNATPEERPMLLPEALKTAQEILSQAGGASPQPGPVRAVKVDR